MTLLMTAHLFCFIKIMKIIKFRVWNTKLKKFFTQEDDQRIDLSLHYWETTKHVEYPQQFTGLKDKNGKEIYEGDVYHQGDKNILYKVIFRGCGFVGNQIGNKSLAGLEHFIKDIEIIGNIYENPELCQ